MRVFSAHERLLGPRTTWLPTWLRRARSGFVLHVCVCVCVCVCVYECIHTFIHIYTCVYMYICKHLHIYTCIYTQHTCACVCVCVCLCVGIYMYIYICIYCIYIYAHRGIGSCVCMSAYTAYISSYTAYICTQGDRVLFSILLLIWHMYPPPHMTQGDRVLCINYRELVPPLNWLDVDPPGAGKSAWNAEGRRLLWKDHIEGLWKQVCSCVCVYVHTHTHTGFYSMMTSEACGNRQ
jgi:hypothetical protein